MRKIIVSNLISLDGFIAGDNGEIDWFQVSEDFFAYARQLLSSSDIILFGRITYQEMESYWPTSASDEQDPVITHKMNHLDKIVFSKTLTAVEWNNSRLAREIKADEIIKLKQERGKDIVIFGSGDIVSELTKLKLIDEYRLIVNPVVLGKGKTLFTNLKGSVKLNLLETKQLSSGSVIMYYAPAG